LTLLDRREYDLYKMIQDSLPSDNATELRVPSKDRWRPAALPLESLYLPDPFEDTYDSTSCDRFAGTRHQL
jgi:hypothetical protein